MNQHVFRREFLQVSSALAGTVALSTGFAAAAQAAGNCHYRTP